MLMTGHEPQLVARSRARMQARDVTLAPRCRRDVTDSGLGGCVEAQGARATSSGGYFAMVIHRTHPLPAYGGPRAVTGGSRGRRDGPTDPTTLEEYSCSIRAQGWARAGGPLW